MWMGNAQNCEGSSMANVIILGCYLQVVHFSKQLKAISMDGAIKGHNHGSEEDWSSNQQRHSYSYSLKGIVKVMYVRLMKRHIIEPWCDILDTENSIATKGSQPVCLAGQRRNIMRLCFKQMKIRTDFQLSCFLPHKNQCRIMSFFSMSDSTFPLW